MGPLNISCTCNPGLCSTGFIAHTQYFFNDLQRVGKEHVLMPVGGASVPSTCRREGGGVWAQTSATCSKSQRILSLILTMCVVWDHEGICRPSTYIFQEISGHCRENKGYFGVFFSTDAANHISISVLVHHVPQVKDTRRCFLVPGKQGSPKVWVSASIEQFVRPWHLRDTFLRAEGDKHSAIY